MSNVFEQELRKLFGNGEVIDNPTYSGRACFGSLGKDLRVRAQFVSTHIAGEYEPHRRAGGHPCAETEGSAG